MRISDPSFNEVPERIIIKRDADYVYDRDEYDHPLVFFATNDRHAKSDKGAECPFDMTEIYFDAHNNVIDPWEADEYDHTDQVWGPRNGFIVFQVSGYVHGGIAYSLGDGSHFPDSQWDVSTLGYLYTSKEREGDQWMMVYDKDKNVRRKAESFDEYKEYLRGIAEAEVKEMNLAERGDVYGWVYERARNLLVETTDVDTGEKTSTRRREYEGDGGCWGTLTDKLDDLDFPPGVPVYLDGDVGLDDEYEEPSYIIMHDDKYLVMRDYSMGWSDAMDGVVVRHSWWDAQALAQDFVPKEAYNAYSNIIKLTEEQEKTMEVK